MAGHEPDQHDPEKRYAEYGLALVPEFLQGRAKIHLDPSVVTALQAIQTHHAFRIGGQGGRIGKHGATLGQFRALNTGMLAALGLADLFVSPDFGDA